MECRLYPTGPPLEIWPVTVPRRRVYWDREMVTQEVLRDLLYTYVGYRDTGIDDREWVDTYFKIPTLGRSACADPHIGAGASSIETLPLDVCTHSERTMKLEKAHPVGTTALKYAYVVNDVGAPAQAAAPETAHRRMFMEEHQPFWPEPSRLVAGSLEAWEKNLTASSLVYMHFEKELRKLRPACPFVAYTIVRHPVDFYLSFYKHFVAQASN
eukprot:scaffold1336_cov379-Prasinococcus_capsulatus_cf.AAC.1